jgi:hypothetical protein
MLQIPIEQDKCSISDLTIKNLERLVKKEKGESIGELNFRERC